MNGHAASFIVNVWRRNGGEYEPGSLSLRVFQFHRRHLRHHRYGETLVESEVFSGARDALKAKQIDLKTGEREPIKQKMSDEDVEESLEQVSSAITAVRPSSTPDGCTTVSVLGCMGVLNTVSWDGATSSWKAMMQAVSFCSTMNGKRRQEQAGVFLNIYTHIFAINDDFSIQLIFDIIVTLLFYRDDNISVQVVKCMPWQHSFSMCKNM